MKHIKKILLTQILLLIEEQRLHLLKYPSLMMTIVWSIITIPQHKMQADSTIVILMYVCL